MSIFLNEFPIRRGRRLRQSQVIRSLVKENDLNCNDLIAPIFIREGTGIIEEIPCSMEKLVAS